MSNKKSFRWRHYNLGGCSSCLKEVLEEPMLSVEELGGSTGTIVLCKDCVKEVGKAALREPKPRPPKPPRKLRVYPTGNTEKP